MTRIVFHLHVKFRAIGITFGQYDYVRAVDVPDVAWPFAASLAEQVRYSDHGILLEVTR